MPNRVSQLHSSLSGSALSTADLVGWDERVTRPSKWLGSTTEAFVRSKGVKRRANTHRRSQHRGLGEEQSARKHLDLVSLGKKVYPKYTFQVSDCTPSLFMQEPEIQLLQ